MKKNTLAMAVLAVLLAACSTIRSQPPEPFDSKKHLIDLDFRFSKAENDVLKGLFDQAGLAQEFAATETPIEKAEKITHLTHGFWPVSKSADSSQKDPAEILRSARNGHVFGPEQRAILLAALLNSASISARVVRLHSEKGKSRWAVEAFLADKNGWALCDAEADFMPSDFGRPLSAAELLTAIGEDKFVYNSIDESATKPEDFRRGIEPFLFAFSASVDCRYGSDRGEKAAPTLVLLPKTAQKAKFLAKAALAGEVAATTSLADFYPKLPLR